MPGAGQKQPRLASEARVAVRESLGRGEDGGDGAHGQPSEGVPPTLFSGKREKTANQVAKTRVTI